MARVVDRFLQQADLRPDAPAVVETARTWSYGDLAVRARAVAGLVAATDGRRMLVAVQKGGAAYAAMFGTLLAGGTYAPVNVDATPARLLAICRAFKPDVILADAEMATLLRDAAGSARVVAPDASLGATLQLAHGENPLAYVIFTSGSTGAPKGVAIPRTALDHYVDWLGPAMAIGPADRMSQHPNIGFDLSFLDIYGALCFGASLYPFTEPSARLLPARKIQADRITIWNSVPSVLSAMALANELDAAHLASVRLFTFCGEVLTRDHVARLFAARPDAEVLNTYGPTEATVAMTCRRFTATDFGAACREGAPIGAAIGDMRLDLVGGANPDEGEIVISGPQLADGYWKDAALTVEKFRPLATARGTTRAFYTGDYAVRRDGEIFFLGRKDDMVKIRGHRLHLGSVRHALDRVGWPVSIVFEHDGTLVAVVEKRADVAFDAARITADLAPILESYAMPSAIHYLARLPRNANDKIDVAAVRAMVAQS